MKIGVAIPTMNRPDMLRAALGSVRKQIRRPDYVFVGDNSDKRDASVEQEFSDLPLTYSHRPERIGVEAAFTWVLKECQGDWVCLLEDDNLFLPRHLECIEVGAASFSESGVIATAARYWRGEKVSVHDRLMAPPWSFEAHKGPAHWYDPEICIASFMSGAVLSASAIAVNKKFGDILDQDPSNTRSGHDRWKWARFSARGGVTFVPEVTVLYLEHPGQIGWDIPREQYIAEGRKVSGLVWDLAQASGVDLVRGMERLVKIVSPAKHGDLFFAFLMTRFNPGIDLATVHFAGGRSPFWQILFRSLMWIRLRWRNLSRRVDARFWWQPGKNGI